MPNDNAEDQPGQELKQKAKEVAAASEEMLEKAVAGLKISEPGSALDLAENEDSEQADEQAKIEAAVSADASKWGQPASWTNPLLGVISLVLSKNEVRFAFGNYSKTLR